VIVARLTLASLFLFLASAVVIILGRITNLATLLKEAIRTFELSVLSRTIRRNIIDGGILHSYSLENLESYIALTDWTL
jgi:hypothetical protein